MRLSRGTLPDVKKVEYVAARGLIEDGDILLCSGFGTFGKVIKNVTDSAWSHVGFVWRLPEIDRIMVLESVESKGVRTVPLSQYVKDYNGSGKGYNGEVIIARDPRFKNLPEQQRLDVARFACDHFSYDYDNDEIAKIAFRIARSHLPWYKDTFHALETDREYICSELYAEAMRHGGLGVAHDPRGMVMPCDIAVAKELVVRLEVVR